VTIGGPSSLTILKCMSSSTETLPKTKVELRYVFFIIVKVNTFLLLERERLIQFTFNLFTVSTIVMATSMQKMQIHKIIIFVKSLIKAILVIIFLAILIFRS
jgi:hypothetical protein